MATINVRETQQVFSEDDAVRAFLAQYGIWYRRFESLADIPDDATDPEVLNAYAEPIAELFAQGNYKTADVINVSSTTPNLEAMLAKFSKEHWHSENEVRFIVRGRGIFHIHPPGAPVFSIEVEKGDMINVPQGTHHWFDLCQERNIRAIRLFEDMSGWTPNYTASGEDEKFQPLCFGPQYFPAQAL